MIHFLRLKKKDRPWVITLAASSNAIRKIDIETELGKGTTFVITLPVTVSEDAVEEE